MLKESETVEIRIARLVISDIRPVRLSLQNEFTSDTIPSVVTSIVCEDTVQLVYLSVKSSNKDEYLFVLNSFEFCKFDS